MSGRFVYCIPSDTDFDVSLRFARCLAKQNLTNKAPTEVYVSIDIEWCKKVVEAHTKLRADNSPPGKRS